MGKHVLQLAFEPAKNLFHALQGGALLAVLQPVERGRRNAQPPGEAGIRFLSARFAEEHSQLSVELARHETMLPQPSFRMRNNWVDPTPQTEYTADEVVSGDTSRFWRAQTNNHN